MSKCSVSNFRPEEFQVQILIMIVLIVGPAVEAFGFQRIVFGSSPSPVTTTASKVGNWYEIAREAFAELGIEQEDIDAIFSSNAKAMYGS